VARRTCSVARGSGVDGCMLAPADEPGVWRS
jgi:hypothetical protein